MWQFLLFLGKGWITQNYTSADELDDVSRFKQASAQPSDDQSKEAKRKLHMDPADLLFPSQLTSYFLHNWLCHLQKSSGIYPSFYQWAGLLNFSDFSDFNVAAVRLTVNWKTTVLVPVHHASYSYWYRYMCMLCFAGNYCPSGFAWCGNLRLPHHLPPTTWPWDLLRRLSKTQCSVEFSTADDHDLVPETQVPNGVAIGAQEAAIRGGVP